MVKKVQEGKQAQWCGSANSSKGGSWDKSEKAQSVYVNTSGLEFGWHMKEGDRKLMLPGQNSSRQVSRLHGVDLPQKNWLFFLSY